MGLNKRAFSWLYAAPNPDITQQLQELFAGKRSAGQIEASVVAGGDKRARSIVERINGKRVARIGAHPDGFDTCAYDPQKLSDLAGVEVDALELETLFDAGRSANAQDVAALRSTLNAQELDAVDPTELDRSLRLKLGLDHLRQSGQYDAFAIRCWPETFTEYGGAVCGPVSMMGEARVPCACEADVYGALTQMFLQEASGQPVFLTDLVDMDVADNTGVVWHCGQAPLSMLTDGDIPLATIHTNRKMPLLYEFPLKPGRVTLMRISQANGEQEMILSSGEMLAREKSFTGTSGVIRFDRPCGQVLDDIMASRLEHHMALAYGDHKDILRSIAGELGLPVLEI
jgi:L-fucose isomerase-like protein